MAYKRKGSKMKRLTQFSYSELAKHRRRKFLKAFHETLDSKRFSYEDSFEYLKDRLTKLQKVENINIKIERLRRK